MHLSKPQDGQVFKKPKRQEDAAKIEEKRTCVGAPKGELPTTEYYESLQNERYNKWKSRNLLFKPEFSQMK